MKQINNQHVLVSGASIAGLTTAWWLNHIGYKVTVVEMAEAPRTAGGAVDLVGSTIGIIKRMGLYKQFKSNRLTVDRIEYKNSQDVTEGTISLADGDEDLNEDIEIERIRFVDILFNALKGEVEFLFLDKLTEMAEAADGVKVSFSNSEPRKFSLVFGCDGSHSGVRKIWFGPEGDYSNFLGAYFSITIVDKLLVPQKIMQMFSVPNKSVMVNAYQQKTDIIFTFLSDGEIPYDYRNSPSQQKIIIDQFSNLGWRTDELLHEVVSSGDFYFDKFCQIKMPKWSKGRVVLIGDAAYCPSPAAGQGGSLAMMGAAAIADALQEHYGNHLKAFVCYEESLRSYVEDVQAMAAKNIKDNFILKTEEEIHRRNTEAKLF